MRVLKNERIPTVSIVDAYAYNSKLNRRRNKLERILPWRVREEKTHVTDAQNVYG